MKSSRRSGEQFKCRRIRSCRGCMGHFFSCCSTGRTTTSTTFIVGRRVYSVPDPDDAFNERKVSDERLVPLNRIVSRVGDTFDYIYDFGHDWRHEILLEAILLPSSDEFYPRCIAGARNGPPEDAGGPVGYQDYLDALANPITPRTASSTRNGRVSTLRSR